MRFPQQEGLGPAPQAGLTKLSRLCGIAATSAHTRIRNFYIFQFIESRRPFMFESYKTLGLSFLFIDGHVAHRNRKGVRE